MKKLLTNRWLHTLFLLGILGGAVSLRFQDYDWIKGMRHLAFDTYNRAHERPAGDAAVIVDLDDVSLQDDKLGQWPWPRTTVARLVDTLTEMGATAIVFDMVFAEDDRTSPSVLARRLEPGQLSEQALSELAVLPNNDDILASSFSAAGNVVTGFTWATSADATRHDPRAAASIVFGKGTKPLQQGSMTMAGVTTNIEKLEGAAAGNGCFGVSPEVDGIIRKVPLFFAFHGKDGNFVRLYPSLAMEALRVSQNPKLPYKIRQLDEAERGPLSPDMMLKVGEYEVPLGADGIFHVYFSKRDEKNYIPAWTVMDKSVDASRIKGKIVLVGTSAEGLKDIRSTPLDLYIPGVDVHLNIINQVKQGAFLFRPKLMQGAEIVFTVAVGFLVIVLAPFVNAILLAIISLSLIAALMFVSFHAFDVQGLLLDPVYPSLTILMVSVVAGLLTYLRAEIERKAVKQAFGLYISPDYMKELAANPEQLRLGGELRDISVMFTDIRGFTSISEQLKPDALIQLMNEFLTPMSDLVMANRGTIDKYMGDAMMAFWNAPLEDADHARNACITALSMNKALEPINAALAEKAASEERSAITLKAGIGVNSGPGAVGNMGSRQRFAYSVLGDAVNLASRLESQTKAYGVDLLIGEATYASVTDFAALELDLIQVKGKLKPVRIYTLLGDADVAKSAEFHLLRLPHTEMLELYRAREFKAALDILSDCEAHAPANIRGYYDMMRERIISLQKTPPDSSWDGVFVATSK